MIVRFNFRDGDQAEAASTSLSLAVTAASGVSAQSSGSGSTTRYWDCGKPSCAWPEKGTVTAPVTTCDINDFPISDPMAVSGCEEGGAAYMCSSQAPWAVDENLAYGFAAVKIDGGPAQGKRMVVQATNTGGDLGSNDFDIAKPSGGVGLFNGCTTQWGAPPNGWGDQYGGIRENTCHEFPEALQSGCEWRFDWFANSDNPTVDFVQVECPAELTSKTGYSRH